MPYIGNSHVVGDHINNFKVLDDISSYTATFDGSSTDVVSTTNETLRIVEHRFVQGQRVTYNNGGGSNIGGLSSGTAYYVSFDTANTIKLATSLVNANNGTLINLTSVGGGTTHTLTAAFDGTNTKFKLTHNSGESGRFNNATQLQVAINNVLQRPNSDPDNFTEGFAVERGNKIVFQTAPTSNDVFWGSIIANSLPTFDIDATAVDNFTGDGSTTDFTLSRIPPNNASIIVTINGVFQHLSDTTTARAYSLEASVVKFTSAPANGDEIQVRHTGFRGATSDSVTGFYGRTGNVTLIATDDILTRNINSSGIITAASFSGDGSGLIGVASTDNIVTGTAATFNTYPVDINAGMTVAGVATFAGNVSIAGTLTYEDVKNVDSVGLGTFREGIFLPDTKKAQFGNAAGNVDLEIYSTGAESVIKNNTYAFFIQGGTQNNSIYIRPTANENSILATSNGSVSLYYDNAKKAETSSLGIDVTGSSTIAQQKFKTSDGTTRGSIYADSNNDLYLLDGQDHQFIRCVKDGEVIIKHDNSNILRTWTSGVEIFGALYATSVDLNDNQKILLGTHDDLEIYHDGSNSYISDSGTGSLTIEASTLLIENAAGNQNMIQAHQGAAVNLYHANTKRLETTSSGINVIGNVVGDGLTVDGNSDLNGDLDVDGHTNLDNVSIAGVTTTTDDIIIGADNKKLKLGAGEELQLYQAGNHSVIQHNGSHYLQLRSNAFIVLGAAGTKTIFSGFPDTHSSMYYNGSYKIRTQNTGAEIVGTIVATGADINGDIDVDGHTNLDNVSIAGVVTATSYYGDGSNLSNVISGVDLKFEGASVGTGVTMLNFVGFNTVTPPASGLSTITSGQNLTIGVRSGSAVEASLTGTSFNVIARSGGNISINI